MIISEVKDEMAMWCLADAKALSTVQFLCFGVAKMGLVKTPLINKNSKILTFFQEK
jgi:hypothetical protein